MSGLHSGPKTDMSGETEEIGLSFVKYFIVLHQCWFPPFSSYAMVL